MKVSLVSRVIFILMRGSSSTYSLQVLAVGLPRNCLLTYSEGCPQLSVGSFPGPIMCRHAQHQHIGCSHFILTHLLSNNCIRKVVRHHEKLIPAQKAEHRQRLHKAKQLMAGCVRVNHRVMLVFDLAAKTFLAFRKKMFCELWAAPYQTLADDPNAIVIGMAGGDLPMGQLGEQCKRWLLSTQSSSRNINTSTSCRSRRSQIFSLSVSSISWSVLICISQ